MKKTNIFIATVLLFLLLAPTKAHAADPDNNPFKGFGWAAEPKACIFYKIKTSAAKEIDITRTVLDTFVAGVVEVPIAATTNMGQEDMLRCGGKLIQDYGLSFDTETATSAAEAADSTLCEEWKQDLYAAGDSILSGSLVSLAANTINTLHEAPVPVNLAYYWDSVKQDTLILNQTAYAQSKATYPAMGLEAILSIWEITRNIAFGVLALVMLVIGMMIMLRKQINPQTVVTVQSMIPRVIVSAILIAFSYPIGALMVSLILPLNLAALGIVGSIVIESFSNLSLLPVLFFIIVSVLGVGVANLIVATVMTIGTLVITIIAGIKGLIILFQMLDQFLRIHNLILRRVI